MIRMFNWLGNVRLYWKILMAPAFLVFVLVGIGAYAIAAQQATRSTFDAVMAGPIHQAEVTADFITTIWATHARLYRLTATAANETDAKKVKAMVAQISTALSQVQQKRRAIESAMAGDPATSRLLDQLKAAVASYLRHVRSAIDMADSDAGAALMFVTSAESSFAQIEKLAEDLSQASKLVSSREIARANASLDGQRMVLAGTVLLAVVIGGLVSFLVTRGIAQPVVRIAEAIRCIARGDFGVAIPSTGQRDELGVIATAVVTLKASSQEAERLRQEQEGEKSRSDAERKILRDRLAAEFEQRVKSIVDTVSQAARAVGENAGQVVTIANKATTRTAAVAEAAQAAS